MRVLVVGAGFAGRLHAEAWRRLGGEVRFYDPRLGLDSLSEGLEWADIVDFCDTPLSRAFYTIRFMDVLASKDAVFYEKPPFPVMGLGPAAWRFVVSRVNAVPVHNYVYMEHVRRLVTGGRRVHVVILRSAPHKEWYPTELTGGGILADHGYHWMYVARELLNSVLDVSCYLLPGRFDFVAGCANSGGDFRFFGTWLSPVEDTILNGVRLDPPPFTEEAQVESLAELFRRSGEWDLHADASIDVMEAIDRAYASYRSTTRGKEPPGFRELVKLLPVDVDTAYSMIAEFYWSMRLGVGWRGKGKG